jgi:hypothetical protein
MSDEKQHWHLGAELPEFAILFVYFWICFMGMALQRWAGIESNVQFLTVLGFVTVKALLVAKFILLGNMLGLARRRPGESVLATMLRKAVALVVLVIVLSAIEEAIVAAIHGRSAMAAVVDLGGKDIGQKLAMLVTLILTVLPYAAARTVTEFMDKGAIGRFLMSRPQ